MSEDVDEFAEVIQAHLLQVKSFLVGRRRAVFLTREHVERVLGAEKGVVVNDLDRRHPVRREVSCDLQHINNDHVVRSPSMNPVTGSVF